MTGLRRTLLACAISLALGGQTSTAQSVANNNEAIEPQSLASALNDFARKTGLQLIYVSEIAQGVQSPGARAGLSTAEALRELLRDTTLTFEFLNERTVAIRAQGAERAEVRALVAGVGAATLAEEAGGGSAQTANASEETRAYSIEAQDLNSALREFAKQTGRDVVYPPELVAGKRSQGAHGQMTERQTLEALLQGTGLRFEQTASNDYMVQEPNTATRGADFRATTPIIEDDGATAEILVEGRRTQNADIRRSEDDALPYVVFDTEEIERANSSSLEDFLRTRLPMNTQQGTSAAGDVGIGDPAAGQNTGEINLRGLGPDQTLILVDGRRVPSAVLLSAGLTQPNISGIPLSAIERIEVLPSTAGGIYGGGATGGVINVVLKRDYSGLDLQAQLGSAFDGAAFASDFSITGGQSLNQGRTHFMVSYQHSDADPLLASERDFAQRARDLQFRNNPSLFNGIIPPLGATTNIRSLTGANLVLDDGTALNSPNAFVPAGYTGPDSDGGEAFLTNAGTYNLAIPVDGQAILRGLWTDTASITLRQYIADSIEAFADFHTSRAVGESLQRNFFAGILPASAPNNPFQQDIRFSIPLPNVARPSRNEVESQRATAGLIARFGGDWSAALEYTWGHTEAEIATTVSAIDVAGLTAMRSGLPSPDGRPALDVLQDVNTNPLELAAYLLPVPDSLSGPFESKLEALTLRVSGPVADFRAGDITFTGLVEHRDENVLDAFDNRGAAVTYYPRKSQTVDSIYAELRAPISGGERSNAMIRELEIQASIRRDEYQTMTTSDVFAVTTRDDPLPDVAFVQNEFESTDYTIGLRYVPVRGITLRASFATGFLPPGMDELSPFTFQDDASLYGLVDPMRGGELVTGDASGLLQFSAGGSPNLAPEQSESYSFGVIFAPIERLRISVDFTRIEKTDEIFFLADSQFIISNEAAYPGRVTRGANLPGDPPGFPGPIVGVDYTAVNLSAANLEAVDIQLEYVAETAFGTFRPYVNATQQTELSRRVLPDSPTFDIVGYSDYGAPLRWRGNFGIEWNWRSLSVDWNAQYIDSYQRTLADPASDFFNAPIVLNQGTDRIPRQVYHDLSIRYDVREGSWLTRLGLSDSQIRLGIQNVFDKAPPTVVLDQRAGTLSGYSQYGDPRLRRFTLAFRKSF